MTYSILRRNRNGTGYTTVHTGLTLRGSAPRVDPTSQTGYRLDPGVESVIGLHDWHGPGHYTRTQGADRTVVYLVLAEGRA